MHNKKFFATYFVNKTNFFPSGESAYMELTATQKSSTSNPEHITRWLASPEFKKIQEKYNIPLGMNITTRYSNYAFYSLLFQILVLLFYRRPLA